MKNDTVNGGFLAVLQSLQKGESMRELDAALASLVKAVESTGKGGSLTYTIKIKPMKPGSKTLLVEDCPPNAKEPVAERPVSIWFAEANGALVRNDPRQRELTFSVETGGQDGATNPEQKAGNQ